VSSAGSFAAYSLIVLASYCAVTYVLRGRSIAFLAMLVGVAGAMFHDVLLAT
jgi:hypothetical protein